MALLGRGEWAIRAQMAVLAQLNLDPRQPLLAAVSGGPDSTALLVALREAGFSVVAAHYDHALQPASASVADHVARMCEAMGVELYTERRTTPMPRGSRQAAARTLRYDFLRRTAAQSGAAAIALGHTADDLVEGALMHLLRGCGIAGMRGMPSRRGIFVRPLLSIWRTQVLEFLGRRGIVAVADPANTDTTYARVRVRRELLPALEHDRPGITLRLHAAALMAAGLQEQIELQAANVLAGTPLSAAAIAAVSEPVGVEVLRQLYARAAGIQPALARTHLTAMLRLIRGGSGGRGVDLPGGLRFRVVAEHVQVVPRVTPSMEISLATRSCGGCDDSEAAHLRSGLTLSLGFRQPGLTMRPAPGRGTRKLQDIFVDAHIPREDRDTWPLVFAGHRLAWVPGVAVDRDLRANRGEPALHVTVTRILSSGVQKVAMLESPNRPPGVPS